MYRHGLRVTDLVNLRINDVNLNRNRIWIKRLKNGLSVEHPIQGDEQRAIKRYLRTRKGALPYLFVNGMLHSNWREQYYRIAVNIDETEANRVGLTSSGISSFIGGLLNGFPITTYWEGDEPVNVSMRLEETYRQDFEDLANIYIPTPSGNSIPLRQVASFEPKWMPGRIARRNGIRTITIRSEAQMGKYASEILADASPKIAALNLPEGVEISYGGDQEGTETNMPYLLKSLGTSILLIFLVLMFQFKDYRKSLIILSTFILAIPGAAIGLLGLGHPFGFTAFLGTISLIGIVVRNGIILVDYADELRRDHGYSIREAALLAAQRRMRPIFLTASAAAIGVVPMILGGSPLWAPLASVLCIGLMWSMFMTLYIIPLIYYRWLKPKKVRISHAALTQQLAADK